MDPGLISDIRQLEEEWEVNRSPVTIRDFVESGRV